MTSARRLRFQARRESIIAAATVEMNYRGVKGMSLPRVAARLDMSVTGLTYYFARKEDMAVACFEAGLAGFDELISAAARAPDPAARLHALLAGFMEVEAQVRAGARAPLAVFSDIRALNEEPRARLFEAYRGMLSRASELFVGPGCEWMDQDQRTARAQMVLEQMYWAFAWFFSYDTDDLPRVCDRLHDILVHGLAAEGQTWKPGAVPPEAYLPEDEIEWGWEAFLNAATRLINEQGYRGASVERISAELNVTKGSFYHHNETKDDLVVACFKRSFAIMRNMQRWLGTQPHDHWWKLSTSAAELVRLQLSERGPLLRTSALSALPRNIRYDMLARSNRISRRFSDMIADGWAEGCLRAVDPLITAQAMMAMINSSAETPDWVASADEHTIVDLYARPLLMGIFNRPPAARIGRDTNR